MAAHTMNVTPHKALGYDATYHAHCGYHADIRQFRPFGCRCTGFRPKEILTSKKLTNRGISCVFVDIGTSFGKCYLAYSKENKVYAIQKCSPLTTLNGHDHTNITTMKNVETCNWTKYQTNNW